MLERTKLVAFPRPDILRLGWVLLGALFLSACSAFGLHTSRIPTGAMEPTIKRGDIILWTSLDDEDRDLLKHGMVVVIRAPGEPDKHYVKRIVGMGGESIEIRRNALFVDNMEIERPYAKGRSGIADYSFGPVDIPDEHVFLMGDNWDFSRDSRVFGPIPLSEVIGEVVLDDE